MLSGLAHAESTANLCNMDESFSPKRWKACFEQASIEAQREADRVLHEWLLKECVDGNSTMCLLWMDQMSHKMKEGETLTSEEGAIISRLCATTSLDPATIIGETLSELCDVKGAH